MRWCCPETLRRPASRRSSSRPRRWAGRRSYIASAFSDTRRAPAPVRGPLVRRRHHERAPDGSYLFAPSATHPAATDVTYDLSVEVVGAAARVREAPRRGSHLAHALGAESPESSSSAAGPLLLTGKGWGGQDDDHAAAAAALRRARAPARSCCSTDPAHSLADAFGVPARPAAEPRSHPSSPGSSSARERLEASWKELRTFLSALFQWVGVQAIEAEELSMLPGLTAVFALGDLRDTCDSGGCTTSSSSTARRPPRRCACLTLPEVLSWWMDRFFPWHGRSRSSSGPHCRSRPPCRYLARATCSARASASTTASTGCVTCSPIPCRPSVRLVVNPERMVHRRRSAPTYLSLVRLPRRRGGRQPAAAV